MNIHLSIFLHRYPRQEPYGWSVIIILFNIHEYLSIYLGTQGPGEAGALWGVTRNLTNMHEFQQMPLGDKFACKDKKEDGNADKYVYDH